MSSSLQVFARSAALLAFGSILACRPGASAESHDAGLEAARKPDARSDAKAPPDAHEAAVARPLLTSLSVTSSDDATVKLQPSFRSDVFDYYVRCPQTKSVLTVSMESSAGAESHLSAPTTSPLAPKQTVDVTVTANDAVVADAVSGARTIQYWVRCMPAAFPSFHWTVHSNATIPSGYYLVGATQMPGYAIVFDSQGVPAWYWEPPAGAGAFDVDTPAKNALAVYAGGGPGGSGEFYIRSLDPLQTTVLAPTGYSLDQHELRVLRNGDYLALSYPTKTGVDLTGLSLIEPDGGSVALGPDSTIQDCVIVEFSPEGSVVKTWAASEHFPPAEDTVEVETGIGSGGGTGGSGGATAYDTYHCNSIDIEPLTQNLLVSSRQMSSVFYVEWSTGKVLWKMGGKTASVDDATYVSVADPFDGQHDARLWTWQPECNGGTGKISVFDDETYATGGVARGVLYDVTVGLGDAGAPSACDGGADGGAPGTASKVWEIRGTGAARSMGSNRILPDGSRVIDWGSGGKGEVGFTVVDSKGNDILDVSLGSVMASPYRTVWVPLDQFDLALLRKTAGMH